MEEVVRVVAILSSINSPNIMSKDEPEIDRITSEHYVDRVGSEQRREVTAYPENDRQVPTRIKPISRG